MKKVEIDLLIRIEPLISRQELVYLLDPMHEQETRKFLYRLGKSLGIDTQPTPATRPLHLYEVSNLDREEADTVLVQVWIHHPTTGRNIPYTVEAWNRTKLRRMWKQGEIDNETYLELLHRLNAKSNRGEW